MGSSKLQYFPLALPRFSLLGGIFLVFVASIGVQALRLQTLGAALVGLIFALTSASPRGIGHGATLSLIVGAGFAAAGAVASSLRLFGSRQAQPPPPH
jgi:hypothetical protein